MGKGKVGPGSDADLHPFLIKESLTQTSLRLNECTKGFWKNGFCCDPAVARGASFSSLISCMEFLLASSYDLR